MRAERPVDSWRSNPPLGRGRPRTDPPGPRRRADRCARAPQKEASDGYPEGHHRDHPTTSAEGGVRDARTPASGTGRAVEHHRHRLRYYADARCRQPAWDISTDARYIPLAVPTTRARAGRATALRAHWANPPVWCHSPQVTHTRTPIYETPDAHNGLIPPLCATPCFLIPSLVCDTEKNARPGR